MSSGPPAALPNGVANGRKVQLDETKVILHNCDIMENKPVLPECSQVFSITVSMYLWLGGTKVFRMNRWDEGGGRDKHMGVYNAILYFFLILI